MKKVSLKDENGKIYFGWFVTVAAAIIMLFGYACVVSLTGVFLLPVTQDLGLPIGQFSVYLTILSISCIVTLFFISKYITEKYIRKIMLIAAIIGALSFFGFASGSKLWHFYLLSVPMGFAFGALSSTPCTVLVSNWFGSRLKGFAIGLYLGITSLLAMAMTNVLSYVVMNYGWRIGYIIIGVCLLVICIPCILTFAVWSPRNKGISRMGEAEEDYRCEKNTDEMPGIHFADAIKKPLTWIALLTATFVVTGSSSLLQHSISSFVFSGYDPARAAAMFSLGLGLMTLGTLIVGFLCDRFKLQYSAIGTSLAFAVVFLCLLFAEKAAWLLVLYAFAYALAGPAVNIISPLMMNHMFGEKELGRFIGYVNMFISIGGAFGATLVGMIYDTTGSYGPAWTFMLILLIFTAIIRGICTSNKRKFTALINANKLD